MIHGKYNDYSSSSSSAAESNNDIIGSSTSGSASKDEVASNEQTKFEFAKRESAHVARLRILVLLFLGLAATSVSVSVYFITSRAEEREAQGFFDATSEKVVEAFHGIASSRLSSIAGLGVATIAHGVDHSREWPFVGLSSFQHRSMTVREQSGALYVQLNPVVQVDQRTEWETFVVQSNDTKWITEAIQYQETYGVFDYLGKDGNYVLENKISNMSSIPIWYYDNETNSKVVDSNPGPYLPVWQTSPLFFGGEEINENAAQSAHKKEIIESYMRAIVTISSFLTSAPGGMDSANRLTSNLALMISTDLQETTSYEGDPFSKVSFPIFDSFSVSSREVVAILSVWIRWSRYFGNILPRNARGVILVINDSCTGQYSYKLDGSSAEALGWGDFHDRRYDSMSRITSLASVGRVSDGTPSGILMPQDICPIQLDIFPSKEFFGEVKSNAPLVITFSITLVFVFAVFVFFLYDRLVERRQALVLGRAEQTSAIVSSLFPDQVANRLMQSAVKESDKAGVSTNRLKSFLSGAGQDDPNTHPIADLFLNCTVLFADISGFTAWSSSRDPAQVFILLQTIYQSFDAIAKRRKVFKVETIGDSYVAVTGLPEPQDNHALIMARFAADCMTKMNQLATELESSLGPDTGDLAMRFGLHSGPVTAGVLRGERARFQLFGDTVNTAARMESTGIKNKIQISHATCDLLIQAGKDHWIRPREETIQAKGKGFMQTYWLSPNASKKGGSSVSASSGASEGGSESHPSMDVSPSVATAPTTAKSMNALHPCQAERMLKQDRLVDWITDILSEHLKKVVMHRKLASIATSNTSTFMKVPPQFRKKKQWHTPLDEVVEVIALPKYNPGTSKTNLPMVNGADDLNPRVLAELREYVSIVASTYNPNPFHNFEHACHVTMAVNKFLKRIVSPDIDVDKEMTEAHHNDIASKLHDYTHGITSDPLTVLAIIFSALVHDADHRGVSNAQLVVEQKEMAAMYNNKSIAEQNSVDICWNLLMREPFQSLRNCLFDSQEEMDRFRQVMVNVVLATDIFDKELNELRRARWERAFARTARSDDNWSNLRATIVIEHIIQASDVAHTMQHWHVYRKWNRRLFMEMHLAYQAGRMAKEPATFWYEGELGFFDNYIIPLAKKLKDCNVFGVSSDECLTYATQNRSEWADRGREVVAEMVRDIADCNVDMMK